MNLHYFVILALSSLVAGKSVPSTPIVRSYHAEVGIPQAKIIKATEDKLLADPTLDPTRIVGGSLANIGQFPYQAGLVITLTNGFQSICGATLVSPTGLISAAHCWWDGTHLARSYEVVLGSNLLYYGGTRVTTTNVGMHIFYNVRTLNNDISIITVPRIEFTDLIQPINLPSGNDLNEDFVNELAVTLGYGRTYEGADLTYEQSLHQVALRVIDNNECASVYGETVVIDSTLCTSGEGGKGICDGDSGGPLVLQRGGDHIFIGVSSFGTSYGCEYGSPSGYVRVTSFTEWIKLNANL